MKPILTFFLEIFLAIIGIPIFVVTGVVGIFYTFGKHFTAGDYNPNKQFIPVLRALTLCADGFANSGAGEMLNDILKVKGKIKYGKWYQTISAVTGLRFVFENIDNRFRKILDRVLGRNHCVDAITEQDRFYYENNR